MTGSVELSVVVPCLNEEDVIDELLDSLVEQSWRGGWELVLADNGSTDRSVEIVEGYRQRLPSLRIVNAASRPGRSGASNEGARAARGTSLVFIDADDQAAPGWLASIGDALSEHRFVASRFDYEKLNAAGEAGVRGRVQSEGLQSLWYPPYRHHAGAGGMGVRRSLFLDVGGFDEDLPALVDTDFCIRVQDRGVPLHFTPGARIHVRLRSSPGGTFRQARKWARYNTLLYRRYGADGEKRVGVWTRYLRGWKPAVRQLGKGTWLRPGPRRTHLAWSVGWQLGLLEGALRYGVAPVPKNPSLSLPPRSSRKDAGVAGRIGA